MSGNVLRKVSLDALGIGASFVCAVHCAVLPLLMTALPLLGLELFENEAIEWCLLGGSFLLGFVSMYRGYYRHHQRLLPGVLFLSGFVCLVAGHLLHGRLWGLLVILTGAVLIISAHMKNLYACRRCSH